MSQFCYIKVGFKGVYITRTCFCDGLIWLWFGYGLTSKSTSFHKFSVMLGWTHGCLSIKPGPEVIILISCSAQLRLKFILLINVKMPTTVGILTFISRINYWLSIFNSKPEISIYLGYISIYEQFKFYAQLS